MSDVRNPKMPEKVDIQMTPLIDIVFQLMAFFLMTFQVAPVEGDFNLKLPLMSRGHGDVAEPERIVVRLRAGPNGELASVQIASGAPIPRGSAPPPFRVLRDFVARKSAEARAAGRDEPDFELDADETLNYEHILTAIESIRGQSTPAERGSTRRIRFAPQRE